MKKVFAAHSGTMPVHKTRATLTREVCDVSMLGHISSPGALNHPSSSPVPHPTPNRLLPGRTGFPIYQLHNETFTGGYMRTYPTTGFF